MDSRDRTAIEPASEHTYSDHSPFVRLFEKPTRVKIIDLFLRRHYDELSVTEVLDLTGISRASFHRNIDTLETLGIIKQSRQIGNTTTYQLDKDSDLTQLLADFHAALLDHATPILDD